MMISTEIVEQKFAGATVTNSSVLHATSLFRYPHLLTRPVSISKTLVTVHCGLVHPPSSWFVYGRFVLVWLSQIMYRLRYEYLIGSTGLFSLITRLKGGGAVPPPTWLPVGVYATLLLGLVSISLFVCERVLCV
jgi:hypothetical protein